MKRNFEGRFVWGVCATLLPALVAGCIATDKNGLFVIGGGDGIDPTVQQTTGAKPQFGATVTAATPPPPISGGTLLMARDGRLAIASDPDRDRIWIVDVRAQGMAVTAEISLAAHAEPGRLVQDRAGLVHVVLRGSGSVATVDTASGKLVAEQSVCPAPRGIAYDPNINSLHVACAGGELVTLPAAGGAPTRTLNLGKDLRDVVVDGATLWVSRFRSAEVLRVDANGATAAPVRPSSFRSAQVRSNALFDPAVAWRMVGMPSGGVALVHQRGQNGTGENAVKVSTTTPGGYGSGAGDGSEGPRDTSCDSSIVHTTVTTVGPDGSAHSAPMMPNAVVPVDLALSPDGAEFAVVAAGNANFQKSPSLLVLPAGSVYSQESCAIQNGTLSAFFALGQPVAVAYLPDGQILVQSREPAMLQIIANRGGSTQIQLGRVSRKDTGHDIFHSNSGASLACASCHPEGGEDGRTWVFDPLGPRRTQSLRGGVLAFAPFHWDGSLKDLHTLVNEVLVKRMAGPVLAADQVGALSTWINSSPIIPRSAPSDPAAVARGRNLFGDSRGANCISCHADEHFGSAQIVDVGTGGTFHVPSLVNVAFRAPFIHDGCAESLADRFSGRCGGGDAHGKTSQLSVAQRSDLVAFLETL